MTPRRTASLVLWAGIVLTALAVVPWRLAAANGWRWSGGLVSWAGAWLVLNGAALVAWCASLLVRVGQGTPLPWDPPKRLVVEGPYRAVRNPMLLGMLIILWGEALASRSPAVSGYAAVLTGVGVWMIHCLEEPAMRRAFGPLYDAYARAVPRWVPAPPVFRRACQKKTR